MTAQILLRLAEAYDLDLRDLATADEDRFWDRKEYEQGRQVELSKEFVRQYYRKIGYHQALTDARAARKPEPEIPPLPDDVTKQVSELYVSLFERLTGQKFR